MKKYRSLLTRAIWLSGLTVASSTSLAGISYTLTQQHAQGGENLILRAVIFNDESNTLSWTPPKQLALLWRSDDAAPLETSAALTQPADQLSIPINQFAIIEWATTVPETATGTQLIQIKDTDASVALQVSGPNTDSTVVTAPLKSDQQNTTASTETSLARFEHTTAVNEPQNGFDRFRSAISAHEPMYFLIGSEPKSNARFQISFKYRLFNPSSEQEERFHNHLYLAYTQRSLWDLSSDSLPFIDTTYNPSFFWRKEKLLQPNNSAFYFGLTTGIEHTSNGKGGKDSRSLNDLYLQPEFNYQLQNGGTLSFMPRIKQYIGVSSSNADYKDYMGQVAWQLRWQQAHGLGLTGSFQQGKAGRKTTQIDLSWPLQRTPLNMNGYLYAQYYRGYGETLLHYNRHQQSQIRFGIALTP